MNNQHKKRDKRYYSSSHLAGLSQNCTGEHQILSSFSLPDVSRANLDSDEAFHGSDKMKLMTKSGTRSDPNETTYKDDSSHSCLSMDECKDEKEAMSASDVNLKESVSIPSQRVTILDFQKDINNKLREQLVIKCIEMCDIKLNSPDNRFMDLSKIVWTHIEISDANCIYRPNNALKLVRLTLKDNSHRYFTAEFLSRNPINFDLYGVNHFLSCPRISSSKYTTLSSSFLKNLNLYHEKNELVYIIRSSKGSGYVTANIFRWKYNDKIVLSDIDGTLTKSDVMGLLYGFVGKDYSHQGVARLFSQIAENGYKILFVSARPMIQTSMTRSYLNQIQEGIWRLPYGPLFLTGRSVISALSAELFDRSKVSDGKIAILNKIADLFPRDSNPFHAAFGNEDSDFKVYRLCGIPERRIFLIDSGGKVVVGKREERTGSNKTRKSPEEDLSYSRLAEFSHLVFPDVRTKMDHFEDFDDLLTWYSSLNPTIELR